MSNRCRICRTMRPSRESLVEHLAEHNPAVLAEEVLRAVEHAATMQRIAMLAERCGKVGYKTERAATNALVNIWLHHGQDPMRREVRAYQCEKCDGRWHLTSQSARTVGAA